jgi:protein-S-isoprenylcysteine O-methyltransferase Ste14
VVGGPVLYRRLLLWTIYVIAWGGVWLMNPGAASPYTWALMAGVAVVALYAIATVGTDLARERVRPAQPGVDAQPLLAVRAMMAATLVLAVLDGNTLHWSPPMPPAFRIAGIAAFLAAFLFIIHAMSYNPFFSPEIRIQEERGHRLVDTGPYGRVRHPGYAGMLVLGAALPLAFGSWWALAPASVFVCFIARRVSLEDRFLHANLPGYREYAARVPSRLVPGLW